MQFQIAFLLAADRGLNLQEVSIGEAQSSRISRRFQCINQRLVDRELSGVTYNSMRMFS
jgi:hypothetical protein